MVDVEQLIFDFSVPVNEQPKFREVVRNMNYWEQRVIEGIRNLQLDNIRLSLSSVYVKPKELPLKESQNE